MRVRLACYALVVLASVFPASAQPAIFTQFAQNASIVSHDGANFADISAKAEAGDLQAQFALGVLYAIGQSVPKDPGKAMTWWRKAAEQGYAPAQERLGTEYLFGPNADRGEAEIWLRRAAMQGNVHAQFWLGAAYQQGRFGSPNFAEALKWLRFAANKDNQDAQACLGQMYEDGEGVAQDYRTAAKWYRKAAEHVPDLGGANQGRHRLAQLYLDGTGVPKSNITAYMWFALAHSQDDLKQLQAKMTPAQIAQAQNMTADWIKQHPVQQISNQ